jgi:hypothetical protein
VTSSSRPLGLLRALTGIVCWTLLAVSCKSAPAPVTGTGGHGGTGGAVGTGGAGGAGGAGASLSCGGTTSVSGSTVKGAFSANVVRVVLAGANCSSPGAPTFVIENDQTGDKITFTLALQADAGANPIVGQQTISGLVSVSGTTTPVSGTVNISAADDPRAIAVANADGGPLTGTITGTMAISDAGVSISGSFQSPYCAVAKCFGH